MSPGFSNWEAKVNPTVADQGKAVATVTADVWLTPIAKSTRHC
jgi:hypothetical protein